MVIAGVLLLSVSGPAAAQWGSPAQRRAAASIDRGPGEAPTLPTRRPLAARPSPPPELPAGADRVPALTLDIVMTSGTGPSLATRRQTVTRTADRVHVATGSGTEWWFEQNPVDRRRVSGYFVEHRTKKIIAHSDSDLRQMLGILGWAHVLTLGCGTPPPAPPAGAAATNVDGVTFSSTPGGAASWNHELLLPGECTLGEGAEAERLRVNRVARRVDSAVLAPPPARFPGYQEMDLAEWLEGH